MRILVKGKIVEKQHDRGDIWRLTITLLRVRRTKALSLLRLNSSAG